MTVAEPDIFLLTAELVDHPSVSFTEGPFVDWIEGDLRTREHLEVTRIGDNLIARTDLGRDTRLILAGHTDTVPVNDNGTARIVDDVLWGVGSADMKGGLAIMLDAARRFAEPAVDVTYVFYAREEVAQEHSGLAEIINEAPELLEGDCAILGEPTDGHIEAGCQGALRFEVTIAGARAHTARPWMGRNAVHRLAPLLGAIADWEVRSPTIDGCTYRESLQCVGVEGGVAGNVVPDRVVLRVHHRFAPDRSVAEAEAHVRGVFEPHLDDGDTVELVDVSPACPPSLGHPLLRRLVDEGAAISAKLGWTDVARFAELGIPATNLGAGDATVAHTKDEHLHRASVERAHRAVLSLLV